MVPSFLKHYAEQTSLNKLERFSLEIYKTLLSTPGLRETLPSGELQAEAIEIALNMLYRLKQVQESTDSTLN